MGCKNCCSSGAEFGAPGSGYDVYDVVARPRLSAKQEEKAGVLQSFTRVSFEMDAATSSKRPTATQSPQTRGREREGEGGSARGRERERKRGTERESDLATRRARKHVLVLLMQSRVGNGL